MSTREDFRALAKEIRDLMHTQTYYAQAKLAMALRNKLGTILAALDAAGREQSQ